jgi:hypothetical protein
MHWRSTRTVSQYYAYSVIKAERNFQALFAFMAGDQLDLCIR